MITLNERVLQEKFGNLHIRLSSDTNNLLNTSCNMSKFGLPFGDVYKLALSFYKEKEGKAVHFSYEDKLSLIAFSQQVLHGPLIDAISKLPPLGALDVVGRDRRLAWQKLGKLDADAARAGFVELLSRRCPLFVAYIEAHRMEKKEQERLSLEAEKRKLLEEERRLNAEAEAKLLQEKANKDEALKEQIQHALNEQTLEQFKNYVEQQFPGDPEKQIILIKQLQDQHYVQYMQQLRSAQRERLGENGENQAAKVEIENKTKTDKAKSNLTESLEENLVPASMWTRCDIRDFKETISQAEGDSVIRVGHGETVTVRVPTHHEGSRIFWEFATDHYDIGFGVYFEFGTPTSDQVSVHVSESDDEEGQDFEDLDDEDSIHPGDFEAGSIPYENSSKPIIMEIVPVYRRDCQNEVYAGSHQYPGEGVYLLKFDNSYSLWRSKTLYYRVYYSQ